MKLIPFILIIIGTIGLLIIELLGISGARSFVMVLAVFNLLGLLILALSRKN